MMNRIFIISILLLMISSGYGCATLINSTTQNVPVTSDPSGAACTVVGDGSKYSTPCQIELARKNDHVLKIEKEGYTPVTVEIKHVLSGAVAGNIIAGGLIGWGVDAASGAQNRLIPETVNVTLKPTISPVEEQPAASKQSMEDKGIKDVVSEIEELDRLKREGKITNKEYNELKKKTIDRY